MNLYIKGNSVFFTIFEKLSDSSDRKSHVQIRHL
jgi:hypothetical protein